MGGVWRVMDQAADGSVPGIDALLAERRRVEALARRLVRDPHAADDVAQEAWLKVLRRPPAAVRSLRGWLASVVRSTAADARRGETRRGARERAAATGPGPAPSVPDLVARAEAHRAVLDAVLALDAPHRAVVLMRFFDGLEPAEIAARLGEPPGTVRSRLHRALGVLRSRLDGAHGGRRAWAVAVLGPSAVPLLPPEPSLKGVLTMTARTKTAVGAAVLLLVCAFLWSRGGGDGPPPAVTEPRPTPVASVPPPEEGPPLAPGDEPAPESAPAAEPAPEETPPAPPPPPAAPDRVRLDLEPLPHRDPDPPPDTSGLRAGGAGAGARVSGGGEGGLRMRGWTKWAPIPERGTATFRGRVLDGTGRPLAGAEVLRIDPKGGGTDGEVLSFEFIATIATTGADGTFEATRQPVRPFLLAANYRRTLNRRRGLELHATVPVDPSENQVLDGLALSVPVDAAAFGTVEGVVVDDGGRPLPGCQVMAGFQDAWTKADGRFRFDAVPAGEVTVSARKFAYGRWSRTETLQAGGVLTLRAVLEPSSRGANRLEGRVLDELDRPVAGVKIWMGGLRNLARDAVTGDDGTFRFEGLPELGEKTVSVSVMTDPGSAGFLPKTVQGVRVPTAGLEIRVERTVMLRMLFRDAATGEPLTQFAYQVKRETVVDGERRMVSWRSGSQYREDGTTEMPVPRVRLEFFVEAPDRVPIHAAAVVPPEHEGPFEVLFELER